MVDDEHIRGFCQTIWEQKPIHPEPVRSWYDPSALDPARYDLHRRRTIHVHFWSDDEFVVLLAGLVVGGLGRELVDQFVADDAEPTSIEFRRAAPRTGSSRQASALALLERWARRVAGGRPERRSLLAHLARTIARDLGTGPRAVPAAAGIPVDLLATEAADLARQVAALEGQVAEGGQRIQELDATLERQRIGELSSTRTSVVRSVTSVDCEARCQAFPHVSANPRDL